MKNFFAAVLALLFLVAGRLNAQIPKYDSYPGAEAVIFLDFDGHSVTGTSWNSNGPIDCAGANLPDAKISEIFNRIAEDFRPFNINVTTDSVKYLQAPALKRMRALFTTSNSWYGNNAGGVAFIGSFTWGDNTPCFIFTALFNYNTKNISEAGSHEVGHTLGLSHQSTYDAACNKTSDYHYGTGNGETSWAPIMGVGYYKNFTVWHNGADPYGCTNTQSDLGIITNVSNGFGFRPDDHRDVVANATSATFNGGRFNINGVISTTDDVDVFRFTIDSVGRFELAAIPYNVGTGNTGSDLDMQVDLHDNTQNIIGSYNPGNALSSIVDTVLAAGTYYLKIDGKGNQYASEYGSLGSYSLEANFTIVEPLPLRRLELKGSLEGSVHKLRWIIDADEKVVDQQVQVSENGRSYRVLGSTDHTARAYSYSPQASTILHYRLKVTFDNGRHYFSNVIVLRNKQGASPRLLSNVITSNTLSVHSASPYQYMIFDYNGRSFAAGSAEPGFSVIPIGNLREGSYLIHFTNGGQRYVEKFIKQ
ncbi:MAG: hypothetical protein WKF70_05330 [Chitinophagaceae bacterium]